jgi:hypothetical protein
MLDILKFNILIVGVVVLVMVLLSERGAILGLLALGSPIVFGAVVAKRTKRTFIIVRGIDDCAFSARSGSCCACSRSFC